MLKNRSGNLVKNTSQASLLTVAHNLLQGEKPDNTFEKHIPTRGHVVIQVHRKSTRLRLAQESGGFHRIPIPNFEVVVRERGFIQKFPSIILCAQFTERRMAYSSPLLNPVGMKEDVGSKHFDPEQPSITDDFCYHNNVAQAHVYIRLGKSIYVQFTAQNSQHGGL